MKLKTGISLFILGLAGVFTLLFNPLPPNLPELILERYSEQTIKWLSLINPTLLLVVMVIVGAVLADKVQLGAPLIQRILERKAIGSLFTEQLKAAIPLGLLGGILLVGISALALPYLPEGFKEAADIEIAVITRFGYGGITEEILLRWGMMSFWVWAFWKTLNRKAFPPSNWVYWTGIIIAALLFGLGHLPAVFILTDSVNTFLLLYIVLANALFGLIAGWLYWKKGLEAAMIAHIMAHVAMIGGATLFN
jgi:hypothetical protein